MKKSFSGEDGLVGAKMDFESKKAGSGSIEIVNIVPNESVQLRLLMTAPVKADNLVEYKLTSEGAGARFTWIMRGNGGFMGKLMTVVIDGEKMVAGHFTTGIASLKELVEGQK